MARVFVICALLFWPLSAAAQEDKGYLTELLESSLGGEGRIVSIDGFEGALSSRATVDRITMADAQGVWLEMTNLVLGWNRGALLRGRVEIEELSAATITLSRLPAVPEGEMPTAEAQGFSLPNLPVAITVGTLTSPSITIGAPVLGQPLVLKLDAAGALAEGTADVTLLAERIDGQRGLFDIKTRFDGAALDVDIDVSEGPDGVAATLIGVPGEPPIDLSVAGTGPLGNFDATLRLATDGQERLAGTIGLRDSDQGRGFAVDLGGDVTALFVPQYRDFFGDDVQLQANGVSGADGTLSLDQLDLRTEALTLAGSAVLDAQGWPASLDITGEIGNVAGTPVLLPLSGAPTRLQRAVLQIQFDAAQSDAFEARFDITNLSTPDVAIGEVALDAAGRLESAQSILADLDLSAEALVFNDPALQRAIGEALAGTLSLDYRDGNSLRVQNLRLSGDDYAFTGRADIAGLDDALSTEFDLGLEAQSLARFVDLVGQDLDGAATLNLSGTADLGGAFDVAVAGTADDVALGIAQADAVLAGRTVLTLRALRNKAGTRVEGLTLKNDQLEARADAQLASEASTVSLDAQLFDAGLLAEQLGGPLRLDGDATQDARGWSIDMNAAGPFDATASADGLATGPNAALNFKLGLPDIKPLVPQYSGAIDLAGAVRQSPAGWLVDTSLDGPFDLSAMVEGRVTGTNAPDLRFEANLPDVRPLVPQYSGPLAVTGRATQRGDALTLETELSGPYGLTASVSGAATGPAPRFDYTLALPSLAPLVPKLSDPLRASGFATQEGTDWRIASDINGPAGTEARVAGLVGGDGQLDIDLSGVASLALANPFITPRSLQGQARFDLAVSGPPALGSVSGQITASDARLAAPSLPVTLSDIDAQIGLNGGRATLTLRAAAAEGGALTVNGPISLSGSYPAELMIALQSLGIEDPALYRTLLDGQISVNGNLTGGARIAGQIDVGETQVTVPSSGLGGFAIIPEITHIGAARAVLVTQNRAGLNKTAEAQSGSGPVYPLDLRIVAPARIFVRGRGLDAELGGRLRLTGDTANIISAGRFELMRGRLDILEKRFDLDEGSVQLQGSFDPFMRFVATTRTSSGTASVIIEGPASSPEVSFTASPEAPQDEVLAQIFFGRSAAELSAFQALQLANAVATLAGQGGESIVSKLRRSFDLDDLDINTDAEGNTAVRAGKYISDNVYTDVEVGGADGPEVSINIDLTPSLTARGTTSAQGDSSIGIFFERDY